MSTPVDARVSGQELERAPRNYGHLIGLAARHARMRLDGTTVVNRASGLPITLTWPRGLREAAAPGSPAELLLALPALPKLLEKARYLGAFPDPSRRADVQRMHGFAANADVAGRPVALCLLARENRRGECSFDRAIVRPLDRPRRQDGGVVPVDGIEEPGPPPNNEGGESKPPQPTPDEFKPGWEPEMGAPMAGVEHLPPGDAREAYQHGYTLEEWQARKHGESWRPPSPPEPGFWTRLGHGLERDFAYRFRPPYGLPPELGGDNPAVTRTFVGPLAQLIDILGPTRGPPFVWDAATRTAAEAIHSAGSSEDPERIKGEIQEGVAAVAPFLELPVRAPELRGSASAAEQAVPVAPRGYSVAYVAQLPKEAYRGSYYSHRQKANQMLLQDMASNPEYANMMKQLGIDPPRSASGAASAKPIKNWTWHHEENPGELHLVPADQHKFWSPHWRILHPTLPWGYRIWGKP